LEGGLASDGDVHVLSLTDRGVLADRIERSGVPVHTLGLRHAVGAATGLMRYRRLLNEIDPLIVHGWMYHGNLFAWVAGWMAPRSAAVAWNVCHSLHDLGEEKRMMRLIIRGNKHLSGRVDVVLYKSGVIRSQHEAFGFSGARGMVIPNGCDLTRFSPDAGVGARMRMREGLPADAIVVGHVARLHPLKNHSGFLKAAIWAAQRNDQIHCVLVGRGVEADTDGLADLIPPAMRGRFHFFGERTDIPNIMRMLDAFCLSSWGEGSPNVVSEAMASGIPCITTDVGGSGDIVGDTGIVVPPRSPRELSEAIAKLCSKSKSQREAIGRAARARVRARQTMSDVVDRYRSLYQSLAQNRGGTGGNPL
jgi:glycosyltransferase involved in cell wall biosynthesis